MKVALFALLFTISASASQGIDALTDFSGKTLAIPSDRNRMLVLFWATWCGDCKAKLESKALDEFTSKTDLAVAVNTDREVARAQDWISRTGLALTVARDDSKKLRDELKSFSVPHWAVYKKSGAAWELVGSQPAFQIDEVRAVWKKAGGAS